MSGNLEQVESRKALVLALTAIHDDSVVSQLYPPLALLAVATAMAIVPFPEREHVVGRQEHSDLQALEEPPSGPAKRTTHNTQHTTHNTQHTTHNTQHTTHNSQQARHTVTLHMGFIVIYTTCTFSGIIPISLIQRVVGTRAGRARILVLLVVFLTGYGHEGHEGHTGKEGKKRRSGGQTHV